MSAIKDLNTADTSKIHNCLQIIDHQTKEIGFDIYPILQKMNFISACLPLVSKDTPVEDLNVILFLLSNIRLYLQVSSMLPFSQFPWMRQALL